MQTRKRILSILLTLALAAGLLAIAPITAHAATGMATINISTLGGADANNSADIATESYWEYQDLNKTLVFTTTGGNYTLTGTNGELMVFFNSTATGANVILNGVNITGPNSNNALAFLSDCTVTLIGNNTLASNGNACFNASSNISCTITSSSGGSLTATVATGTDNCLNTGSNTAIIITGNASVTAASAGWAIGIGSTSIVKIGDNAKLTLTGDANNYTFEKDGTATTHKWKLTNATLASGYELTDDVIKVTVAAGQTATIEREPIAAPTPTKGIFCTNARWYGEWWHYVLFFLGFGFLWMWF